MTENDPNKSIHGYTQMLKRVVDHIKMSQTNQAIHTAIHKAQEMAVELGELTREEAEKIADYLQRDLHAMGEFMHKTGQSLHDWLEFDTLMIEAQLLDLFLSLADKTQVEWRQLFEQAPSLYRTGEVTGVGRLQCSTCGAIQHFHQISQIQRCQGCHGDTFIRPIQS